MACQPLITRIALGAALSAMAPYILAQGGGSVTVEGVNANALPTLSTSAVWLLGAAVLLISSLKLRQRKMLGLGVTLFALGSSGLLVTPPIGAIVDLAIPDSSAACSGGTQTLGYDSDIPPQLTNECTSATITITQYSLPCPSDIWQGSGAIGTLLAPNESTELLSCGDYPPEFTLGLPITIAEDAGAQLFNNWITGISPGPASESAQTVSFATNSDQPALFSVQPAITTSGTLSFTAADNAWGTTNITVTATDSAGSTSSQHFVLTITPVNDTPSFTLSTTNLSILEDNGQDLNTQQTGLDFDSPPAGDNFTQVSMPNVVSDYHLGTGDADQTPNFNVAVTTGTRSDANRDLSISAADIFYGGDIGISASGALEFKLNPHHWGELQLAITLSDSEGLTTAAQSLNLTIDPVWDNLPTGNDIDITGLENSTCIPVSLVGQSYRGLSQPVFIMTSFTLDAGKNGTLLQDGNPVIPPLTTTNPDFCFVPYVNQYSDFDFTFGTFDVFAALTYRVWSGLGDADTGLSPAVAGHTDVYNELSIEYQANIIVNPDFGP
ncbi:hypothetical protein [Gilvimarinus sp. 1_MG-2023]|uniref:hypothetical protein n=1 Tax=Gilvimarinus sp. 1_MG-2023 TaxID=3062638 RepID=UPI0026E2CB88|nr:hypothetical protein [Gilvimarinus sp. 1_MG-2023]MDO6747734.1 hypothetical protein [Gilvimarinus sp. 1_MG-2023]